MTADGWAVQTPDPSRDEHLLCVSKHGGAIRRSGHSLHRRRPLPQDGGCADNPAVQSFDGESAMGLNADRRRKLLNLHMLEGHAVEPINSQHLRSACVVARASAIFPHLKVDILPENP
ncbi:hypothetical protein [Roseibium polysiphoniae]|uniref:Uncharacterized protein n=1 Tax=Roseibium polysiphoniae TaxID=2571221 RepID=A0ABR9C5D3_9HYPH|nr:hypothetical protein [Roseibium polysiphoniae]MBD8875088.1 hypothetical protein [Roseibium polysiphoniae]